jgi:galactokinase/mevalonate kinase-like predicted kinase
VSEAAIDSVLRIISEDRDGDHRAGLRGIQAAGAMRLLVERLRQYLRATPETSGDPKIHLRQERAVLVLGDVLWGAIENGETLERSWLEDVVGDVSSQARTRSDILRVVTEPHLVAGSGQSPEDEYLAFINQFMTAVNESEMRDFSLAKEALLRANAPQRELHLTRGTCRATVPMRVGISSANASDNWTFSKLRGGVVVNFAVDLGMGDGERPRAPVAVTVEALGEPVLELRTDSLLDTDRPTHVRLTAENAVLFYAIPPDAERTVERCFKDVRDPLLLLKYALVFSGIVGFKTAPDEYLRQPARLLADVARFGSGRGLRLSVWSRGPSRSGFASSSCVSLGLLRVLYEASGQTQLAEPHLLSSLALLLENEIGLKSGKQDTDGPLYPGVKSIRYAPTSGFLEGEIECLRLDERALGENLILVNSGIQRPAATGLRRGLNMRHYAYVSRDPRRFPAVMQSLEVHREIVAALLRSDWSALGQAFNRYLDLRETIDPGATQSVYDEAAGAKVLRLPFERLRSEGLIEGGMYTGAMGGGCLMLVATPLGKKVDASGETHLLAALRRLQRSVIGDQRPFGRLEVYRYAVNSRGLECESF